MSESSVPFSLPPRVASPQDLTALIIEIHTYAAWFSNETIKSRVGVVQPVNQPELSPVTLELLRAYAAQQPIDRKSLDTLISILETYKKNAPIITITLAAPATLTIKSDITHWCRQNIAQDLLVQFRFNSTLLGGMVVRYGSRIFDWSFRTEIMKHSSKLPEILSRV